MSTSNIRTSDDIKQKLYEEEIYTNPKDYDGTRTLRIREAFNEVIENINLDEAKNKIKVAEEKIEGFNQELKKQGGL